MSPLSAVFMEGNNVINQEPATLLQLQDMPWNEELLDDPAVYDFPLMKASAELPGTSKLSVENFANYPSFMRTHDHSPIGYFSSHGFASTAFDNDPSKWNEMVGIIDVEPQLNRESDSSTFNHEVHFFPLASKAGSYNMHGHYKKINVLKPLEAQLLALPQSGKQIGENGRIFLHPDNLCEILIPTAEESDGSLSLNKCCHLQWDKELLNQPIFEIQADNNFDPVAETTVMYRETMASAFAVLENMRRGRASSPTSNMDPQQISHGIVEADNTSHVSSGESSHSGGRENSGSLHEDTQDLEALMSSDEDEMSTGRSPTDCTWNNTSTDMSNGYSIDSSSGTSKRKACDSQWFEEDEVDILCQEVESELKENICPPFCHLSCSNDGNYQTSASLRTCEPVVGRPISNSSAGLHASTAQQDILNAKLGQAYASLSGYSAVRKGPRKEKIKMIVKLLRTIIPGGNSMDTADVLGEAIQYVRKLQFKVSKLEASKRARI